MNPQTNVSSQTITPQAPPPPTPQTASTSKNKGVALILACLLGFFKWLYTYKYRSDQIKFAIALVTSIVFFVILKSSVMNYLIDAFLWLWAIFDTLQRPPAYYTQYPHYLPGSAAEPANAASSTNTVSDDGTYQTMMPTKNMAALKSYYYGCIGIIPVLGLPFTILAIINGRKGLEQYRTNPTPGAKGHAKVGLWLSYIEIGVLILFVIIFLLALKTSPNQ